jgi:hypothetical protein
MNFLSFLSTKIANKIRVKIQWFDFFQASARLILHNATIPTDVQWKDMNATEFMTRKATLMRQLSQTTTVMPEMGGQVINGDVSTTTTMNVIEAELAEMEAAEQDMLEVY